VGLTIITVLIVTGIVLKDQYQTLDWQEGSYHMNPIYDFSILQKIILSTVTANIEEVNLQ
jgi:cytochrome b subunit of formate dehydrogenase